MSEFKAHYPSIRNFEKDPKYLKGLGSKIILFKIVFTDPDPEGKSFMLLGIESRIILLQGAQLNMSVFFGTLQKVSRQ